MVETCMNALNSISLYSFVKVGFVTELAPGTYSLALSSSTEMSLLSHAASC